MASSGTKLVRILALLSGIRGIRGIRGIEFGPLLRDGFKILGPFF